jgi:LPS export ABC transporter protein LptC
MRARRRESGRWRARITGLLAAGAVLLLAGACEEPGDIATVPEHIMAMEADFIIFGGEQYITEDGVNQAHMTYDTAFQWVDSTDVALRRVHLVVFNEDGSERAQVTSDRGIFDQYSDRMVAQGNVVLVFPGEERTLRTEELHYDPQMGQMWSDSAFVLVEPGRRLEGSAFETDLEFQSFRVRGGIR